MNYIIDLIKLLLGDFRRNKVRASLTSLGILIGVLSTVLIIGLNFGLKSHANKQLDEVGKNLIMILPQNESEVANEDGIRFNEKDVSELSKVRNVQVIEPIFIEKIEATANGKTEQGNLLGTTDVVFSMISSELEVGKFFTSVDVQRGEKVVVVGGQIAEKLFGSTNNALHKTVRLQNQRFIIMGVLKKFGFWSEDDLNIYVPYSSLINLSSSRTYFAIYLRSTSDDTALQVKKDTEAILLKRYKKDDFIVMGQAEFNVRINSSIGRLNIVLVSIGLVSLVIVIVGIASIMRATKAGRTKENSRRKL